jgi:hypothetical protein
MQRSSKVEIRTTDLEKADWQKAAGGARRVSEWLRGLANAEVNRLTRMSTDLPVPNEKQETEQIIAAVAKYPRPESKPLIVVPTEKETVTYETPQHTVVTRPLENGGCPRAHHHRPGRYCGTCKKVATKVGE